MKTLMQIRKRLGHLAIGPLVGALLAGLLLIVLMLNINNDENPDGQNKAEKHAYVNVLVKGVARA
ncbi:MAG TPA: hypothetical protein VF141_02510 [Chryseolinea sp.]